MRSPSEKCSFII